MFLYYDRNGVLKEYINEFIKGGDKGKEIYIYWEDYTDSVLSGSYKFINTQDNKETVWTPWQKETENITLSTNAKRDLKFFEYGKTYTFMKVELPADDVINNGYIVFSFRLSLSDNKIVELSDYSFYVENGYISLEKDKNINVEQWNTLIYTLNNLQGSGVQSIAGLTGNVTREELANTLLDTGLIAKTGTYVPLDTSLTGDTQAYVKNPDGSQKMLDVSYYAKNDTLVVRNENGDILVNTPTADNNPANKKYVDDNFVKQTIGNSRIYGTNASGGQTSFTYSIKADAGTIALRKSNGNVATGTPTEDNDATNKKYVDNLISTLNSMTILNKNDEAITATEDTIQTVATDYIANNYSREPKSKDGLIITIDNDKILYVYSENSSSWLDVSKEGKMVDLSNYYTKDDVYSKEQTASLVESYAGLEVKLIFNGTKESGTITFELENGITLKDATIYTLELVYTGDIADTDVVLLKDAYGEIVVLNSIKNADITASATIKNIKQLHREDNGTHYWLFEARYEETTSNGITYKNMYTDCVINVDAVEYVDLYQATGTLTDAQLAILQASNENKITFQGNILSLNYSDASKMVYSSLNNGVESVITITLSSKTFVKEVSKHTSYTAGTGIAIENGVISVSLTSAESTSF